MLTHSPAITILPVKNLMRARDFYEKQLGLRPEGFRASGQFVYRCGGDTLIALFPKEEGTRATHTALSFRVDDINAEVQALQANGVVFEDYDLPGLKTVKHVCILGAEKAAWFKDTEGNLLCIHEDLAS